MKNTQVIQKLEFTPLTIEAKQLYTDFFPDKYKRGCELTFANLYAWGYHEYAVFGGYFIIYSVYGKYKTYHYPIGEGDIKSAVEAMMLDARERGVDFKMSGVPLEAKEELEGCFSDVFKYKTSENSYDYIYNINDLADLDGKKYHAKRNHIRRFIDNYPDYKAVPIDTDMLKEISYMAEKWYQLKTDENPEGEYEHEYDALKRVLSAYDSLEMDGIAILNGNEILAFTIGSHLTSDTFDVQFEKAFPDIQGAYPVVNRDFARYLREKYPEILYLDREEDMGIEGLRRAKQSYYPCDRTVKLVASLSDVK